MKGRIFVILLALLAPAAFGAQGQRELTLAGALTRNEISDFCEVDEPDCDDTIDSNLVAGSFGYHFRNRIVFGGGIVYLRQDNGGDSYSIAVFQPTVKYYLGDEDAPIRLYAKGGVNMIMVDVNFDEDEDDEGSDDEFGLGLGIGVEKDFDGPFLFVEVRYDSYSSLTSISVPFGLGFRF